MGLAGKTKHEGHGLWIKCLAGDPKAWAIMKKYNVQDVRLLEEMYELLRPWISNHPNHGLYSESLEDVCTNCGSGELARRGFALTNMGKFQRYVCKSCGTWVRGNKRVTGTNIVQTRG